MPERVFSQRVDLPDGRKVHVVSYDDGSVRFRLDGSPYALTECYVQGNTQPSIIKVVPLSVLEHPQGATESWTIDDLHLEFQRYKDQINASDRAENTKATYIPHAERFVRWLAGENVKIPR